MLTQNKNKIFGNIMLLSCAIIWGFALVAQRTASDTLGPFAFDGLRFFLATAVLIITLIISEFANKKRGSKSVSWNKSTVFGGILCGIALFFGNNLQQIGVAQTSVGKASFITAIYIVIVPLLGLLMRRRPSLKSCYAIIIALIGFYLMCMNGTAGFNVGDTAVLGSAFMISFQIVFVDIFVLECDPIKLTLVQFITASVMSVPAMAIEGFPSVASINANIIAVLYVGILSAGVAFTLQTAGQRYTAPSTATLIMSLESAIGMLGGILILHESYTVRELLGCLLVFVSVFIAQFSIPKRFLKADRSTFFIE